MKFIIIGIQGAGKSTQGNLLKKALDIPYLSTGHIFREMAKEHTQTGRYIKEVINSGSLVPDSKTMEIVSEYLKRPEYEKGYIMDGFPRTLHQAETFANGITKAIYLKVSDKEALWRLAGRSLEEGAQEREDDATLKAILKRIELFHKHTEPVLKYYRQHHKLVEVNGEQSIEAIHKEIMEKLQINE
ncbi:MAG TPA: nucleoside monophosphate kinase [Patescibacteria group bacterium]|nr:nucleoside monophosphate kinase [Patescibacteria group bacterium]